MLQTRILFAVATLLTISTLANSADAGCGTRSYGYRAVVHHRVRVVHNPVVVTRAPVIHRPVLATTCPRVPAGSKLTLPANFLGAQPGHVFLAVQGTKLPANIIAWTNESVTFQLPPMALVAPLHASLDIILPHGRLAKRTRILLIAPPQVLIHESGPQAPLPTLGGNAPNVPVAPQGTDILLPTNPAQPQVTPPATPPMNGGAGIPFAPPQDNAVPFGVLPPNSPPTGASASLLDAINANETQ